MNPKVSIITVCYNAEEFIEHAINSVFGQTYTNIEYLIIDGNSNDNTIPIINKYKAKIDYFISEPDNGIYDAMNKGIKAASGEILYFLNSDDVFYNKYVVENVVKEFQENKSLDLIYGSVIIKNPLTSESFAKTYENISKYFFVYDVICQQSIFYKSDNFQKCGLFDIRYKIVADYEWELRAFFVHNLICKYYPMVIVIYRDGGISNSNRFLELLTNERRQIMKIHFTRFEIYKYRFMHFIKRKSGHMNRLVALLNN